MIQTIDYNEMYFCKSYSEKDHNKHMDQYQKHGYGKANTRMLRSEIAGVPVIEDFMQNYLKLKLAPFLLRRLLMKKLDLLETVKE